MDSPHPMLETMKAHGAIHSDIRATAAKMAEDKRANADSGEQSPLPQEGQGG